MKHTNFNLRPELPKAPTQSERLGVSAVVQTITSMSLIWRATTDSDVGIDGQIEHVDDNGCATGCLVAVQIKSGVSYFRDKGNFWLFTIEEKHRLYWERFPIPVIFCLHNPELSTTYWLDARQFLRNPENFSCLDLLIPKSNVLQNITVSDLFKNTGGLSRKFLSIPETLSFLIKSRNSNNSFCFTYFDLFVFGLTNICRSLFCGFDLVFEIVDGQNTAYGYSEAFSIIPSDHDFFFNYILFLSEQHIADINISDCLTDWIDWQICPQFLAPLTSRGKALVLLIDELQDTYGLETPTGINVAQEGYVRMVFDFQQARRFEIVRDFQKMYQEQNVATQIEKQ